MWNKLGNGTSANPRLALLVFVFMFVIVCNCLLRIKLLFKFSSEKNNSCFLLLYFCLFDVEFCNAAVFVNRHKLNLFVNRYNKFNLLICIRIN